MLATKLREKQKKTQRERERKEERTVTGHVRVGRSQSDAGASPAIDIE